MKNKFSAIISWILVVCFLLTGSMIVSAEGTNTVGEAQNLIDGIVSFKLNESGADSIQDWIDGYLAEKAGILSEWYIVALSQSGDYDFSSYHAALKDYLASNNVRSATSRQKYAFALAASGSGNEFIASTMEDSIGQQGIMSWVFGLHMLNNGYSCNAFNADDVKQTLLSLQLDDGGWALTGNVSDIDVTAMTVQALAPYYNNSSEIKSAIDNAIILMSSRQLVDGDYPSYGVPNPESTAQVLTALSALGIDAASDERFIKNGNDLIDGIGKFRLDDGSFSHKLGDASNETATMQAMYSLVSYIRMSEGKSGLHVLDHCDPDLLSAPPAEIEVPEVPAVPEVPEVPDVPVEEQPAEIPATETPSEPAESEPVPEVIPDETPQIDEEAPVEDEVPEIAEPVIEDIESEDEDESLPLIEEDIKTSEIEADSMPAESTDPANYKLIASSVVVILAIIICLVLFLLKKRSKKNFIAVIVLTIVLIIIIFSVDIQSKEEYYNGESSVKANTVGTVTMTIRCDTVVGKSDSEYIPDNGIILDVTEFAIDDDDTALDILTEAARKYSIQMENTGSEKMAYIAGINYLYEYEFGDLSGWMYYVNNESPSVGCDMYDLSDGDHIEWLYTCELGNDLK